ncbi:ATP-binding protein [Yinghuangia seranimata]|uniref:ATP-binding protein n=1 Tax=Yinghuangia seranimata TaxID=408067 RepID=UPI00248CD6B3|nr:LuxR family transcriptional regulator [Yinghuangia seranimata]MDI2124874.1 LuxR C-terminal-related transcriptional regulator [Yinghuangia seranimata]
MELLERERPLDALRSCPPGHVALVSGEAGIGKTTLVGAFCEGAGIPVLWGACDALRTPRPLGPLRDIARQTGGELAKVVAEDGPRHAAFTAFLDHVSERDCVAVVEDAHWADEATIDLLLFAARRIAETRCVLVVTYREDEVGPAHPLRAMVGALATDRSVRRVRLRPLSAAAVGALAGPRGLDGAELHARTGGNPFFVTEVLADPDPTVPETVRDAVLARAAALGPEERRALESVALFPGHAPLDLVQAPPEAVDSCVAAGMLVAEGARVRFRHELARLAVEDGILPGHKAALHRRALDDLARRGADAAVLAHHAEAAGDAEAVLRHATSAAERASAVGAHRQAADHYAQAVRFAGALPARQRAELLEHLAEECGRVERAEDAVAASLEALACRRAEDDTEREAALLARRAHYLWSVGENDAAHASMRDALALAERLPEGPALAAVFAWSAHLLMLARDIPGAVSAGQRAIGLAERYGEETLLIRALNAMGSAQWFQDPAAAEQTLGRCLDVARRIGDDAAVGAALLNLGSAAGEIRRYETAERWLRETVAWCATRDLDAARRYATAWLARCLFERGLWSQAAGTVDQAAAAARAPTRIVTLTVLGRLRTRRGDPGAAEVLDEAWESAVRTGDLQRLWPVAAGRAELAWLAGSPTDALVRETYGLAVRLGHSWAIGELGQWLEPPEAPEAAAAPYRADPVEAARAWEALGCPYEAASALARSPEHLTDALRVFEQLGARPAADRVAKALRDLGRRAPRRSTLAHPNGLTAREADVLDLLREGLRNAEIAERLSIAPKTVDHHVSAVLAKLGVRTRREAARRPPAPPPP